MNEPFVPIEDVANHFSVSISTVRAWVRQEHIPKDTYIKIGNTYRFRVGDVSNALTKKSEEVRPQEVEEVRPQEIEEVLNSFDLDDDQ